MTRTTDESAIRDLVAKWARAVRAKDLEGVLAYHADDIVMFDVPMPFQSRGIEEYRQTWELFFTHSPGGPGAFDVTELSVTAGDAAAYCHALVKIFTSTVRVTIGLRKQNGRWLIAHEHHSYPIELPSEAQQNASAVA